MTTTRIYVVTDSETDAKRLVRASSRAQAAIAEAVAGTSKAA